MNQKLQIFHDLEKEEKMKRKRKTTKYDGLLMEKTCQ